MDGFVERFEARHECQRVVLDYAYLFLFGEYPNIAENQQCKSISSICRFFTKKYVHVRCNCSAIFFLNPILAVTALRSIWNTRKESVGSRYAVITYSSALELYGIKDLWNHYICETVKDGVYSIYDPYYRYITEDYDITPPELTRRMLVKAKKFQLFLWIDDF